ncbi:cTAGE family member 5 isoform X2 [Lepisosteus oculatus]|uniref:cTAGE family member 5 isoform X2 n=1 Tax=Lepisosteus oculatus TaxID=7918 RepID=UPI0037141CBE
MVRGISELLFLPALLFLLNTRQSLGLLSDYKTCGDLECESSINRVRAIRNYKNPDCRFLNFRSGDVIFVYHKLSGKRDDLWAGTIGKRFGYFPKDAVEVEETYATKEVQVPTKEHDFFCLDGNGAFIESDSSHWDSEEHQEETARDETESPEASGSGRGSVTEFKNSEGIAKGQENGPAVPHTTDRSEEPKTVERGGSHWLGSGITGWLGIGGQEDDVSQEEKEEQYSFRSRKIALDLKDNDLDGNKLETVAEAKKSGWLGGQLSNIFGLSQETPSEVVGPDAPEKQGVKVTLQDRGQSPATSNKRVIAETETTKEEDAQSKSWLSFGVGDLLSYGQKNSDKEGEGRGENTEGESKMLETAVDAKTPRQDFSQSQVHTVQDQEAKDPGGTTTTTITALQRNSEQSSQMSELKAEMKESNAVPEVVITKDEEHKKEENTGWYGSVYDNIVGFYKARRKAVDDDSSFQGSQETGSQEYTLGKEVKEIQGEESQSMYSIGNIKDYDPSKHILGEESLAKFSDEDKEHVLSKEEPIISGAINISGLNQNSQEEKNRLKEEEPPAVQLDVESVMEHDVISSYSEVNLKSLDLSVDNNASKSESLIESEDHTIKSDGTGINIAGKSTLLSENQIEKSGIVQDITENVSDLQGDSEAKVRIEETSASENTENMLNSRFESPLETKPSTVDEAHTSSVPEDPVGQKLQVDEAHILSVAADTEGQNLQGDENHFTSEPEDTVGQKLQVDECHTTLFPLDTEGQTLQADEARTTSVPVDTEGQTLQADEARTTSVPEDTEGQKLQVDEARTTSLPKDPVGQKLQVDEAHIISVAANTGGQNLQVDEGCTTSEPEDTEGQNLQADEARTTSVPEDTEGQMLQVDEARTTSVPVDTEGQKLQVDEARTTSVPEDTEGQTLQVDEARTTSVPVDTEGQTLQADEARTTSVPVDTEGQTLQADEARTTSVPEDTEGQKLQVDEARTTFVPVDTEGQTLQADEARTTSVPVDTEGQTLQADEARTTSVPEDNDSRKLQVDEAHITYASEANSDNLTTKETDTKANMEIVRQYEEEPHKMGVSKEKSKILMQEDLSSKMEGLFQESSDKESLNKIYDVDVVSPKDAPPLEKQSCNGEKSTIMKSAVELKEIINGEHHPEKDSRDDIQHDLYSLNVSDVRTTHYNQGPLSEPRADLEDTVISEGEVLPVDGDAGEHVKNSIDNVQLALDLGLKSRGDESQETTLIKQPLSTEQQQGTTKSIVIKESADKANEEKQKAEVPTQAHSGDTTADPLIEMGDSVPSPNVQTTEDGIEVQSQQGKVLNDVLPLVQPAPKGLDDKNLDCSLPIRSREGLEKTGEGNFNVLSSDTQSLGVAEDGSIYNEKSFFNGEQLFPSKDGSEEGCIDRDSRWGGCKTAVRDQQGERQRETREPGQGGVLSGGTGLLDTVIHEPSHVERPSILDQRAQDGKLHREDSKLTFEGEALSDLKDTLAAYSNREGMDRSHTQMNKDEDLHAIASEEKDMTHSGAKSKNIHWDETSKNTISKETSKDNEVLIPEQRTEGTEASLSMRDQEVVHESSIQSSKHLRHEAELQDVPHCAAQTTKDAKVFKEFKKIQAYMTTQDIQYLLDVFGRHKLLWLDYSLENTETGISGLGDDDLAIFSDFERVLEHHQETVSVSTGSSTEGNVKEDDFHCKSMALQKLEHLLSTLNCKSTAVAGDISVNENSGTDMSDCFTVPCVKERNSENRVEDGAGQGPHSTASRVVVKHEKTWSTHEHARDSDGHTKTHTAAQEHATNLPNGSTTSLLAAQKQDPKTGDTELGSALKHVVRDGSPSHVESGWSSVKLQIMKAVSSLPEDMRPGPDLYGLPWEAVILTAFLGGMTVLMFFCRSCRSVKSRLYVGKERKLGEKVAELLEEKCKVLETLSECKRKYEKLETTLKHGGLSEQATEKENLQVMSKKLEQSNAELKDEIERLKQDLDSQKATRSQQGELLAGMQLSLKSLEEEARDVKSQMEQAQTTLKVYDINSERLKKSIQTALEENSHLHESESQLAQEAEGWEERLSELAEELKMCESSRRDMQADSSNKEEQIKTLTDCLLKMKDWDSELEEDANEEEEEGTSTTENGDLDMHQKQKVQKLIYAARMNADLKSMEEEKTRVFARLADEVKTKEDLRDRIGKLQTEKSSLQVESAKYTDETQKLQQKLQIMTEMYQENELKLHRKLTVEEKERLQKEQKLTKADEKISLAAEELNTYRQRTKDLEEELERTYQAYKNQISSHEKKAHDNWLAARAADRDLGDIKRENSHLRQKLTDAQFRLELVEKDPYALDVPGRPLFRGERSPFGPSPLGRPSSETRAFLSPPTLLDGPARLSPQFPGGPGGRGYPYPDPNVPYRRPPPMPTLPPRLPGPAEPHGYNPQPADRPAEASFPENSSDTSGVAEGESKDSFLSIPGDPRVPPDADPRGGPPFGLRMRGPPRDHFPRRPPFGPPELFHPRVAGAPPMGLRGPLLPPPPPGMFPRFAPPPPPHHLGYPPPRPPSDGSPRPCPAGGEQAEDQLPPAQDMI